MSYMMRVLPHPLGVVVINEANERELLIEGEECCGVSFNELQHVAITSRQVEVDDAKADQCRLKQL
jgi:hypothetical protein